MLEGLDEGEAERPEGDVVGDVFREVSVLVFELGSWCIVFGVGEEGTRCAH